MYYFKYFSKETVDKNVLLKVMSKKYIRNTGKPITPELVSQIGKLASKNTPTRVIGLLTGRTVNSVRSIASVNSISLKPTNQSPYNRKK